MKQTAQPTPISPKTQNACRQPMTTVSRPITSGATAPPRRAQNQTLPWAAARLRTGNQSRITRVRLG